MISVWSLVDVGGRLKIDANFSQPKLKHFVRGARFWPRSFSIACWQTNLRCLFTNTRPWRLDHCRIPGKVMLEIPVRAPTPDRKISPAVQTLGRLTICRPPIAAQSAYRDKRPAQRKIYPSTSCRWIDSNTFYRLEICQTQSQS